MHKEHRPACTMHRIQPLSGAVLLVHLLILPNAPISAAPPELIYQGSGVTGLTGNDHSLLVALRGNSPETCALDPSQKNAVLVSISLNTLNVAVLRKQCSAARNSLVATNTHLYFRESDGSIRRMAVGGGPTEILAPTPTGGSSLALDGTHVYWGRGDGGTNFIHRVLASGGVVETVASFADDGHTIRQIQVDGTHIYWAEGTVGSGAIKRLAKGGGAPQTLASPASDVNNAAVLALDGGFIYFGELATGRVRRVPTGGGPIFDFVTDFDPDYMVESIAVRDAHLIWADTTGGFDGRLRRGDKGGGAVGDAEVTNLSMLAAAPGNVFLTPTHVYWSEGSQVFRQEIGAAGLAVDLTVRELEVTQGLQDLPDGSAGTVPLFEDKVTWVRVYPEVDFEVEAVNVHQNDVTLNLRGFRDGGELPGSPLFPTTESVDVRKGRFGRDALDLTFNFLLPASWIRGDVLLRAEINPGAAIPESDHDNNVFEQTVSFDDPDPLCLVLVPVRTAEPAPSIHDGFMADIVGLLHVLWPAGRIHRGHYSEIKEGTGGYELDDDGSKILNKLEWIEFWAIFPDDWCENDTGRTHFVGVVEPQDAGFLGLARLGANVAWIQKLIGTPDLSMSRMEYYEENFGESILWPNVPMAGSVLAQELAHNLDRRHVDCGNPEDIDNNYPYDPCRISDETPRGFWGFDHRLFASLYHSQWTLVSPLMRARDFLSYSAPFWVSDYTYGAILDENDGGGGSHAAFAETDDLLIVSALIHADETAAQFEKLHQLPGSFFGAKGLPKLDSFYDELVRPGGRWELELRGAGQVVLDTIAFEPLAAASEDHHENSFILPVRSVPGTESIVLTKQGVEMDTRAASLEAPVVDLIQPDGGEAFGELFDIEWTSSDDDGDTVTHDIFYSPDNGSTWCVLAQDIDGTTFTLDRRDAVAGSTKALVRVVATDGFWSATDESTRPFTVDFRPPTAYITRPRPSEVLDLAQDVVLRGGATDPEDGSLTAVAALSWFVDGQPVGQGPTVTVSGLARGEHRATLRAVDSHGGADTVEVDFVLAERYCTLLSRRLQIVFVVENSSLMDVQDAVLCRRLPLVMDALATLELEVESEVVSILGASDCSVRTVAEIDAATQVAAESDWPQAIVSLARTYEWSDDATRLIVPVVLQPPLSATAGSGDPIAAAADEARAASVAVAPWLPLGSDGSADPTVERLAARLAERTGGRGLDWNADDFDVALDLLAHKARLGCRPEVAGFVPTDPVLPGETLVIFGDHLNPGVCVEFGGEPATVVDSAPDGSWVSFSVPPEVDPGAVHTVRVKRPGSGSTAVPDFIAAVDPSRTAVDRAVTALRFNGEGGAAPEVELTVEWSAAVIAEGRSLVDWSTELTVSVNGQDVATDIHVADYVGFGGECDGGEQCSGECPPGYTCSNSGTLGCACQRHLTTTFFLPLADGDEVRVVLAPAADSFADSDATNDALTAVFGEQGLPFLRGDANDDATVDISDAIFTLGALFGGVGGISCEDAGDSNDDGTVDISDPINSLNVLFVGVGTIPSPGITDCGVDPTADDGIGCAAYASCP